MFSGCLMQGPCGNDTGPFYDGKNQPSFELTRQHISLLFSTSSRPRRSRISKQALAHCHATHSGGDWVMEGESGGSFLPPLYTEWRHWYTDTMGGTAEWRCDSKDSRMKLQSKHLGTLVWESLAETHLPRWLTTKGCQYSKAVLCNCGQEKCTPGVVSHIFALNLSEEIVHHSLLLSKKTALHIQPLLDADFFLQASSMRMDKHMLVRKYVPSVVFVLHTEIVCSGWLLYFLHFLLIFNDFCYLNLCGWKHSPAASPVWKTGQSYIRAVTSKPYFFGHLAPMSHKCFHFDVFMALWHRRSGKIER